MRKLFSTGCALTVLFVAILLAVDSECAAERETSSAPPLETRDSVSADKPQCPDQKEELRYEYMVKSGESPIGTVSVTRSRREIESQIVVAQSTKTRMEIRKLLFFSYELDATEHVILDEKGTVLSYALSAVEDGKAVTINGRNREKAFMVTTIEGTGKGRDSTFPMDQYDMTSAHLPLNIIAGLKGEHTCRILDLESLKIQEYAIRNIGKERVEIGKASWDCRIVEIRDRNGWFRGWIARDRLGAILIKEQGADSDGPYSILLATTESKCSNREQGMNRTKPGKGDH